MTSYNITFSTHHEPDVSFLDERPVHATNKKQRASNTISTDNIYNIDDDIYKANYKNYKKINGTLESLELVLTLVFPYLNLSKCLAMLVASKKVQSLLFSREVIATLHRELPSNALNNYLKQHKWQVQSPFINALVQTAKVLEISETSRTKPNPKVIAQFFQSASSLTTVSLYGIDIDRQVFDALPVTLQTLKLQRTSLDPVVPHLPYLKELSIIDCYGEKGFDSIDHIEKLCSLQTIERLKISHDQITNLAFLTHLTSLQHLAIFLCRNLPSQELKVLKKLALLNSLEINSCENITSIQEIANLRLTHLCLHQLNMKSEQIVYLKKMTSLKSLTFEHHRKRLQLPLSSFLSSLKLTQLTLQNSDILPEDTEQILQCTTLEKLSYAYSSTSILDLSRINYLINLKSLDLTGFGPKALKKHADYVASCSSLQKLIISKPSELPEDLLIKFRKLHVTDQDA